MFAAIGICQLLGTLMIKRYVVDLEDTNPNYKFNFKELIKKDMEKFKEITKNKTMKTLMIN